MHLTIVAMTALVVATLVGTGLTQPADDFVDHGVAADVSRTHGAAAVVDGAGHRVVLSWLHSFGSISKIAVNIDTGETVQFDVAGPPAGCGGPFSSLRSSRNLWYTHSAGYFYEFDPDRLDFSFVQAREPRRCAMSFAEDDAGVIWAALYPTAELLSFNPDTRELVNHGALNEEDWVQYPQRGLAMDEAGWIYTGIGNVRAQVLGFNPADGEIRKYVPEAERVGGYGRVFLGSDGRVYATAHNWGWHVMSAGEATAIEDPPDRDALDILHHAGRSCSSDGVPVLAFPDGSRISSLNIEGRFLVVQEPDGTERRVEFDYESGGALVVGLVPAPTGEVYGVTGRPNYFFRLKPETGKINGVTPTETARWNAITIHRGALFGATYSYGWLTSFDFDTPLNPGNEPGSNPRRYASEAPHINRPAALLAHPDGRHMIMGGTPGYGMTGGGLLIYDLDEEEGTILTHEELLQNLSTCSLVALPDGNLVGGTTTAPGTGGERLAAEAELYIFDWNRREVIWRQAVLPGRQALLDMLLAPDGLVYGVANDATLFVFDPTARQLVHEEALSDYGVPAGSQSPRMMALGPDGNIYALFRNAIVRIEPRTFEHSKLADSPFAIGAGIVMLDGRIYFGSGSRLFSYGIPGI